MKKITKLVILGYLYAHREELAHHTTMLVKRVRGTYDPLEDQFDDILDRDDDDKITLTLKQTPDGDDCWVSQLYQGTDLIFEMEHPDLIAAFLCRPLIKFTARMHLDTNFQVKGKT